MKAIEFQSKIENGKIKIPEENLKDFNRYIGSDLKVMMIRTLFMMNL